MMYGSAYRSHLNSQVSSFSSPTSHQVTSVFMFCASQRLLPFHLIPFPVDQRDNPMYYLLRDIHGVLVRGESVVKAVVLAFGYLGLRVPDIVSSFHKEAVSPQMEKLMLKPVPACSSQERGLAGCSVLKVKPHFTALWEACVFRRFCLPTCEISNSSSCLMVWGSCKENSRMVPPSVDPMYECASRSWEESAYRKFNLVVELGFEGSPNSNTMKFTKCKHFNFFM